jgi:hypothetical protein
MYLPALIGGYFDGLSLDTQVGSVFSQSALQLIIGRRTDSHAYLNSLIIVDAEEEGDRVPLLARSVHHAVNCALVHPIGPTH